MSNKNVDTCKTLKILICLNDAECVETQHRKGKPNQTVLNGELFSRARQAEPH